MNITFGHYITCIITVIICFWPGKALSEKVRRNSNSGNWLVVGSWGSVTANKIFGDD